MTAPEETLLLPTGEVIRCRFDSVKTTTFRDFTWRSRHSMQGRSDAAAHLHWHTYTARFWFTGAPDQDALAYHLEARFGFLHGADLNVVLTGETSDEAIACYLMQHAQVIAPCVRVTLSNDGQRGAEVEA